MMVLVPCSLHEKGLRLRDLSKALLFKLLIILLMGWTRLLEMEAVCGLCLNQYLPTWTGMYCLFCTSLGEIKILIEGNIEYIFDRRRDFINFNRMFCLKCAYV